MLSPKEAKMKIKWINSSNNWREIANAARTTIGMEAGEGEPSRDWKRKILQAEHSPIRLLKIRWKWTELPYWVSVHFTRHKIGIEHFVRSQRTDRTLINREKLYQGELVEHECEANAQAIINISRDRLCQKSACKTTRAWTVTLSMLKLFEPELWQLCVSECVYRGFCPEFKTCGYVNTEIYKEERESYINAS